MFILALLTHINSNNKRK
ncbi:hypothetical protein [Paenibacillus glacialis]|nr:hypothetical protein [Paenibacillus glacialis]